VGGSRHQQQAQQGLVSDGGNPTSGSSRDAPVLGGKCDDKGGLAQPKYCAGWLRAGEVGQDTTTKAGYELLEFKEVEGL
jgi:hypothetical protein